MGVHSLIEKSLLKSWDAHQSRIRALHLLSPSVLVTASSCDHSIKVWGLDTDRVSPVRLLCSVDTLQGHMSVSLASGLEEQRSEEAGQRRWGEESLEESKIDRRKENFFSCPPNCHG